jgi:hypothetical protein
MKTNQVVLLSLFTMLFLWNCDVTETNEMDGAEDAILSMIELDDSTYALDGWDDIEESDFSLAKQSPGVAEDDFGQVLHFDSTSVWRFGRRDMNQERTISIEVEDDTSAIALISHHISGTFHSRQFQRVWTSDSTWERGDSIRFSTKPIDLTVERRVAFIKITDNDGAEHWRPVSRTMAYGSSSNELELSSLEWIARDSIRVLDDFSNRFYGQSDPLVLIVAGNNRLNAHVSNETDGETELVRGHWGYHPRLNEVGMRTQINLRYVESAEDGSKTYSRRIDAPNRPNRMFRGSLKVVDYRTLFDHDYPSYDAVTLGFTYFLRRF